MARRIVTGWSEAGEPAVLFAGETPVVDFGTTEAREVWIADVPADPTVRDDPAAREWRLEPPEGGAAFRLVTFEPGAEVDLHRTNTVDCCVVLSGELTLVLPGEELRLGAGDTVVQQATPHGWRNGGAEPCTIAVVLLSAKGER